MEIEFIENLALKIERRCNDVADGFSIKSALKK